jgi:uncharacterized membrane protein YhhN
MAPRFVAVHGTILGVAAAGAIALAPSWDVFVPLLLAGPLLGLQLVHDFRDRGRDLAAEVAGAAATGSLASSLVLFGGWSFGAALGLWLALAVKGTTTVLYVRARLRSQRGQTISRALPGVAHAVGVGILLLAAVAGGVPWTAPIAMTILAIRAVVGLATRRRLPAKTVGAWEAAYGVAFVLVVAAGYV